MIRDYQPKDLPARFRLGGEVMRLTDAQLSWALDSASWNRDTVLGMWWAEDLYWAEAARRIILNDTF
jgi:hypothetical protein